MKKNIGTADRLVRLFFGVILVAAGLMLSLSPIYRIFLVALGAFSVFQAVVGWCALYALLGKNTCPLKYE